MANQNVCLALSLWGPLWGPNAVAGVCPGECSTDGGQILGWDNGPITPDSTATTTNKGCPIFSLSFRLRQNVALLSVACQILCDGNWDCVGYEWKIDVKQCKMYHQEAASVGSAEGTQSCIFTERRRQQCVSNLGDKNIIVTPNSDGGTASFLAPLLAGKHSLLLCQRANIDRYTKLPWEQLPFRQKRHL